MFLRQFTLILYNFLLAICCWVKDNIYLPNLYVYWCILIKAVTIKVYLKLPHFYNISNYLNLHPLPPNIESQRQVWYNEFESLSFSLRNSGENNLSLSSGDSAKLHDTSWEFQGKKPRLLEFPNALSSIPLNTSCLDFFEIAQWKSRLCGSSLSYTQFLSNK